jgi:uncharacterized protein involved in outer membrane biogenesis
MKKALKITGIIILILSLTISLLIYAYADKIQSAVLKEVNKNLAVEGSYDALEITFWRSFPRVALRFKGFSLKESAAITNKHLIEADDLYLAFNVFQMLRGTYELERVSASGLHVRLAMQGDSTNYNLFHEKTDSAATSDEFVLDLKAISLENAQFEFYDMTDSIEVSYFFDKLKSSGTIRSDYVQFKLKADGKCNSFVLQNTTWPINKQTKLDAEMRYTFDKEQLEIIDGTLAIEQTALTIAGYFHTLNDGNMSLSIASSGNQIQHIAGLLPSAISEQIAAYQSKGTFSVKADLTGPFLGKYNPELVANIRIQEGVLTPPNQATPMSKINMNATLVLKPNKTYVQVPIFSFNFGDLAFSSSFELNDFNDPYINGKAQGAINLAHLDRFFDLETWDLKGLLQCDFSLKGKVSELSSGKLFKEKGMFGSVTWKGLSLSNSAPDFDIWKLTESNAHWTMKGNLLSCNNFSGKLNGQTVNASVSIEKLLPYLLADAKLDVLANIKTNSFKMPSTMQSSGNSSQELAAPFNINEFFPDNISLDLLFDIGSFAYEKIALQKLKGSLFANNHKIQLDRLSAQTAGGSFDASIYLSKKELDKVFLRLNLDGKNLAIQHILNMFDNFGQAEITHENLSGSLSINTQLVCLLNKDGSFAKEDLYAFTELSIANGALKNYDAMNELSAYAEVTELSNIRFNTLSNTFEIRDGEINFPYMDIGNNVLNLRIKGKHHFDNYMDYTLRIKLSDALAAKYKIRSKKQKDDYEDLGDKGIALFISVKGYADNLEFKLEKIGGRPTIINETVVEDAKQAKKEFKETIKQEFSAEKREERKRKDAEQEKVDWDEW